MWQAHCASQVLDRLSPTCMWGIWLLQRHRGPRHVGSPAGAIPPGTSTCATYCAVGTSSDRCLPLQDPTSRRECTCVLPVPQGAPPPTCAEARHSHNPAVSGIEFPRYEWLQGQHSLRPSHDRVNRQVGHGSMAASPIDDCLKLVRGCHHGACLQGHWAAVGQQGRLHLPSCHQSARLQDRWVHAPAGGVPGKGT